MYPIIRTPQVIKVVRNDGNDLDKLGRAFLSEDRAERSKAFKSINLASKEYGDAIVRHARNRNVLLSSFAGNPTSTGQNTPGAIVFGDADREMVDLSWTALFTVQDNRNVPNDTFIIEDVYNAVEFREYVVGAKVDIGSVQADRNRFEYRTISGGFQYESLWADDYPYWSVADGVIGMQTKYALKQEQIAIETLVAAGGIARAYAATDVATINAGMTDILSAIYTDTRPDGEATNERIGRPVFFLLYNQFGAGMTARVNAAIAASYQAPNDVLGGQQVNFPVIPIATPYVTGASWNLVLPGRKNVYALKNDLVILPSFDPFVAGGVDARIGHARIGCVRGDANQVAVLATS